MTFTGKHDDELHNYFAGVLKGRCGLRSSMGGQLDAVATAAVSERRRPGVEYMLVKPEDRHAHRDFTVTDDMIAAAREIGRMERVLGRLDPTHLALLRAHYSEPSKAEFRTMVVVLGDEQQVHELIARATAEDRAERRDGRKAMASAQYQTKTALVGAQEAYAAADEQAHSEQVQARKDALVAGLT